MPTLTHIAALWTHFKATALSGGLALGWGDPVWHGRRMSGDDNQTVLVGLPGEKTVYNDWYDCYRLQVSIYHAEYNTAVTRGQAVAAAYSAFRGGSNMTPAFSASGWTAQFVRVRELGVAETPTITGGNLYKYVVMVDLINFRAT